MWQRLWTIKLKVSWLKPHNDSDQMTQIIGEEAMGKLEGKIALVTGGSSGIGLATAKQFVNEGAYVFITGRHQPELDAAVKDIGRNITAVSGDVSKLSDLDHLFDQIRAAKENSISYLQTPASRSMGNSAR